MQKNPIIVIGEKESQNFYSTLFSRDERIEVHFYKKQADFNQWSEADMILLDCGFSPEIGLALLKVIKSSRPRVPVVFLTSVSSDSVAINAFRLGAIDYFKKQVNIVALRNFIENLLNVKRSSRERRRRICSGELETDLNLTSYMPSSLFRAVRLVENNLSFTLPLKTLAREANYSEYHFCRVFKKHMGMSPKKFVAFRRIERAKELLTSRGDLNISMVAAELGFNDASDFAKIFKKFTGVLPSAFRKLHEEKSSS
jgi:AraC-like DNA-binding protein